MHEQQKTIAKPTSSSKTRILKQMKQITVKLYHKQIGINVDAGHYVHVYELTGGDFTIVDKEG